MSDDHAATGGDLSMPELRFAVAPITHVDVRNTDETHDDTWTMSGYAAVFNSETTLYNGRFLKLTETIDSRAFDRVLREQDINRPSGVVHFNFGHDMNRAVAATDVPSGQPGSLQLRADAHGLFFMAKVSRDDPDAVAMAAKMRSGVVRQASFAFTVAKDEILFREGEEGPDVEHRTILELEHLYDVCATTQGAYSQTISGLRSLAAVLGQPEGSGGSQRQPVTGGAIEVNPETGGDEERRRKADAEAEKALEQLRDFRRKHARKRRSSNG